MSRSARLVVVLVLNVGLVAGLVVVGVSAHSLGVLAEGADYLADAAAIGISLSAIWLSNRPATSKRPDGHPRAMTVAAFVNAGWLLLLCLLVVGGATDRLVRGTHRVDGLPVLIASGVAAVVMLCGALVLGGDINDPDDEGGDLTMRAVLLDTVADAAAAAGVAISGAVILAAGGLYWLDPTIALIIAMVVAFHAARLLAKVVQVVATHPDGSGSDSPVISETDH